MANLKDMTTEELLELRGSLAPSPDAPGPEKHGSIADPIAQGFTFGFNDELSGLIGGAYYKMKGREFDEGYKRGRELSNRNLDAFRERNPKTAIAAEVAGALPTMAVPGMAPARATTLGARVVSGAKAGAKYGALYGTGTADEGLLNRTGGAATGAALGATVGALAEPVTAGAGALADRFTRPFRRGIAPTREAQGMIASARQADDSMTTQPRLSKQDMAVAADNAQPVLNIDRGGEKTRELARNAANVSAEGRIALKGAIQDRFEGQGPRIVEVVKKVVGGRTTDEHRFVLQAAARKANKPAYDGAYAHPKAQAMWDEALYELTGAPEVQNAMRQAGVRGRSRAALDGFEPIKNPFISDPTTGRLSLREGATPNLQFWDHVKRGLDKVGTRETKQMSRVLRDHLDEMIGDGSYKRARAGAAEFFGAEDALSAGEAFVTSRMGNDQARRALKQMSDPERQLFSEGFADTLVRRLNENPQNRDVVINSLFNSPASKERIYMALGKTKAREIEAALRIEHLLDFARKAMGNSTTAQQQTALQLAGGLSGAGYGFYTGDWATASAVISGILTKRGSNAANARVYRKVGELLASPDPALVQKGIATIARRDSMLNKLRAAMTIGGTQNAEPVARSALGVSETPPP